MNIELLAMELVEALLREVMTEHKPRICRKTGEKPFSIKRSTIQSTFADGFHF